MARISLVVCDLCKENIEGAAVYGIALIRYNDTGEEYKENKGEICPNCYRSLVSRLNKEVEPASWLPPRAQQAPSNSRQSLRCVGVQDDGSGVVGVSDAVERPPGSKKLCEGEFKVPSQAHIVPREKPNCKHDRKSFADNGELICLECSELLGKVESA